MRRICVRISLASEDENGTRGREKIKQDNKGKHRKPHNEQILCHHLKITSIQSCFNDINRHQNPRSKTKNFISKELKIQRIKNLKSLSTKRFAS